jgi:hypothetical protein
VTDTTQEGQKDIVPTTRPLYAGAGQHTQVEQIAHQDAAEVEAPLQEQSEQSSWEQASDALHHIAPSDASLYSLQLRVSLARARLLPGILGSGKTRYRDWCVGLAVD